MQNMRSPLIKFYLLFFHVFFFHPLIQAQENDISIHQSFLRELAIQHAISTSEKHHPPGDYLLSTGTPGNDITIVGNAGYLDGGTSGFDMFFPTPGDPALSNGVSITKIRCTSNVDYDEQFGIAQGDRIILGTYEMAQPLFLAGTDRIDNEWATIHNFNYRDGYIQLPGNPEDYSLVNCINNGCNTEGWYLFYNRTNGVPDLIAIIYACDDIDADVTEYTDPIQNPSFLCNADSTLSLDNPRQFRFAAPISGPVEVSSGIRQFGTLGNDQINGITVDSSGNFYIIGATNGNFYDNTLTRNKLFIAKYAADGTRAWITEIEQPEGAMLFEAITDNEYLYVVGRTLGQLKGFTNQGSWDALLLKVHCESGGIVNSHQWGSAREDIFQKITFDDVGRLHILGTGEIPYSNHHLVYLWPIYDKENLNLIQLARGSPNGGPIYDSPQLVHPSGGITYSPNRGPGQGDLIVSGSFTGRKGQAGFLNTFYKKSIPSDTTYHFVGNLGIIKEEGVNAYWISDHIDDRGITYAAGFTTGSSLGEQRGNGDAFIIRYRTETTPVMTTQQGTPYTDHFQQIVSDEEGNIYAVGYTYGDYFSDNRDTTHRSGDIIIQKFDAQLNPLAGWQFGTPYEDRAVISCHDSLLYIAGITEGHLGGQNRGAFDGFFLKLNKSDLSINNTLLSSTQEHSAALNKKWLLYPNPTRNQFTVDLSGLSYHFESMTIFNALGNRLLEQDINKAEKLSITMSDWPDGVYYVVISGPDGLQLSKRLMKL